MVKESVIEEVVDELNVESEFVQKMAEIMNDQPALFAFLNQDSIEILLDEEKDVLWYIVLVIYKAVEKAGIIIKTLSDNVLETNEERNWTTFNEQKRGTFREKVTVFFNDYHQEDLLAFIEDTVEIDDESPITTVGRDVIFITCKTVVDTMLPKKNEHV